MNEMYRHIYYVHIIILLSLQAFLIVSDPTIVKHILKDNSKAYSKVWNLTIVAFLAFFSHHYT